MINQQDKTEIVTEIRGWSKHVLEPRNSEFNDIPACPYAKAAWEDNKVEVIFKEDKSIQSPVATIFYEYYNSREDLNNYINLNRNLFQCIVSNLDIPFGQSQFPKLTDYADQKDTIEFLLSI